MTLESPHLPGAVPATYVSIAELIPRLVGAEDPFVIVDAEDPYTYAQVLWTEDGFLFEYQTGRLDQHFCSDRRDLTVEEAIAALNNYAAGAPIWSLGLEFSPVEVRSAPERAGGIVGRVLGSLLRLFC